MIVLTKVDIADERERLFSAFMVDVRAVGGSAASVAKIGRLLRSALESECDRRRWAALDLQLAALLYSAAQHPHQLAVCRLYSYLRENQYGA